MSSCCAEKKAPASPAGCCGNGSAAANGNGSCATTKAACCMSPCSKPCSTPCSTAPGGCCDASGLKMKLTYFNIPARAELIRWVLNFAKMPFEDVRISFADWPAAKNRYPTHELPVFEYVDAKGKTIELVQSSAIIRAVATFTGLVGHDSYAVADADQAFECLRDVVDLVYQVSSEKDATRKEQLNTKLKTDVLPTKFAYLEKKLIANGGKFFAGDSYTYVDLAIACFFDNARTPTSSVVHPILEKLESEYPKLATLAKTIAEMPQIKAYLAKRPAPEKH